MNSIDTIVARLTALHPKLIDLSLDRMWRILAALGHPEATTAAGHPRRRHQRQGLDHRLHARDPGGGRPARCTSTPRRIWCASTSASGSATLGGGRLATDEELADALAECERANGGAPITVFEITTAAGLLLFARHPADVLLLEVGLGGRLDATNVVEHRSPP